MKSSWSNVRSDAQADAVIVVPPPSPSDTNPPLGPAIVARSAARAGFTVRIIDLNILHIRRFREIVGGRDTLALGDHGKDRALVAHAAEWLYKATGLYASSPQYLPEGTDPVAGMHYPWRTIRNAVQEQSGPGSWWQQWLHDDLFARVPHPPPLLGVSVMGPSQVFPALVVLALAKQRWPDTVTVAGGSHITLLADLIQTDSRYRQYINVILPGHSEDDFTALLRSVRHRPSATAGKSASADGGFEYVPLFPAEQLSLYEPQGIALPLQFTRGCAYARCTFCTYPAVEPVLTPFAPDRARAAVAGLAADHGIRRFSVKDSLFTVPMMTSFAHALASSSIGPVSWSATTKACRALARAAPLLADSGLSTVELGVESIHPRTQRLFGKQGSLAMIEDVIGALASQRILVVINLIFGSPGETRDDAERQLAWYIAMRDSAAGLIDGSLNLLEIVRGSPMESQPPPGVAVAGVAPWAYCYQWNAPEWRVNFQERLRTAELAVNPPTSQRIAPGDLVSGGPSRSP